MAFSNKLEKIHSRKSLAWHEEKGARKGDKRNKPQRLTEKRSYEATPAY